MRVLFVSYEFTFAPFSGNGVLSRSLACQLLRSGHQLRVLCCRPSADLADLAADAPIVPPEVSADEAASLELWAVSLSAEEGWRRLDDRAAWRTFAAASAVRAAEAAAWAPEAALVIDWHGGGAWRALRDAWPASSMPPPVLYFNFRVYASGLPGAQAAWFESKEREALAISATVLSLSQQDCTSLRALCGSQVELLLPPLRGDVHRLAQHPAQHHLTSLPDAACKALATLAAAAPAAAAPAAAATAGRRFLTCVVRLSREKRPLRFVELVEAIGAAALRERGVVPLLCGAAAEATYADECRRRLSAAVEESVVLEEFLGAAELAAVYVHSALNVHPAAYDAYGMTLVEAAAFGAPSLVQSRGSVGATALLGADGCLELDLERSAAELAAEVLSLLDSPERLARVAATARQQALGWSEQACGVELSKRLHALVTS